MSSTKRYMKFVKPYTGQIIGTLIIGLIKFAIPLLIPVIIQYVIDDIVTNQHLSVDEKTSKLLITMSIMLGVFVVLRPPIEFYRQYFAQWTSSKILYDIRDRLFTHLQKLSFKFYSNTRAGEVISRVINDVEQTKDFVITGLMNVWLDAATIIIAVSIMFTMDVPLTLVSLIVFPLYAISVKYFFGNLRKFTRVRSQALAEVQGYLHERVQGMPVIKSFAIEDTEQERFRVHNSNFLDKALQHTRWTAKAFSVVNTLTDIAPLIVIGFAGYQAIHGNLSIGTMAAFIAYIDRLYSPLRRLVNSGTTLTQSIASMDRVFELMDEKYDIDDAPDAIECKNVKGDISFEHVNFAYNEKELSVLKDIQLHVRAGETIALVGMSGGGKSSLVSLIPRFYDVTSGKILLDGTDIRDFKVRSLRDKIGMVLQDNILFSESVRLNILLGKPDATEEEIIQAAKAANAHEFIMNLPEGYDTKVGERGVKLSGGQKQRIAIARVFLKNPPILILDEATSALDLESEHLIQEALEKLAKDRTTFIVAHRLSTITHADRIVLIEHGEIVEIGPHEELMEKQGHYFNLFQVQQLDS
ncbi:ABC transporter ATP-binding protein [Heyndrickxia oleronia]|uniref:ABC transporter ATP-binding protein n=1 Tax=Heyndrickxia oleronia TaxID=38875 RepID=UPI0015D33137|nr:ABC transporter ATP-binding protein [Heyndrickxia oleronia]NYV68923.1 ABC transporter ATP-binding protein [Bacillus sp. Gen3]MCI1591678.1 ABC transporter ATP-binding protein/permease [Heyndrickxia oleronia]MCI1614893.1 ABC transporter ATP-binding protein/permease [Heyndrickxia oleronia]MCI1745789.1 ABC transporter ATP-binding protein/permease [Heyndrickxia oleronia]MCI1762865.1 ABC transporter ATP-binding protein/permease [Heyndrickxia oleronia]